MGMTIDEAFYCLSNDKYACSKCRHLCSKHNCREEAVNVVIETMRKYQRIQEIINNAKDSDDAVKYNWLYEQIRKVLEDGKND